MTTQTSSPAATPRQAPGAPVFNISRVYLKGTSLEIPHSPDIFKSNLECSIGLTVKAKNVELEPGVFEVVLVGTLTLTETKTARTMYLLEVQQAGIFEMRNLPKEHVEVLLAERCPEMLQNYLRVQITDTLSRATLPRFTLPEIDWRQVADQAKPTTEVSAPSKLH